MRVTIIVHDANEAPVSLNLAGRSADELDQLQDDVFATLAHIFSEARQAIEAVAA